MGSCSRLVYRRSYNIGIDVKPPNSIALRDGLLPFDHGSVERMRPPAKA
jgi:hypothetical protein